MIKMAATTNKMAVSSTTLKMMFVYVPLLPAEQFEIF